MAESVKELTKKNFYEFVKKGESVVDFFADWCGPCRIMSPIFEETATKMKGKVKFGKVNIDNNFEIAQEYGVRSIPTIIIFKDGEQADRIVGVIDDAELINKINKIVN